MRHRVVNQRNGTLLEPNTLVYSGGVNKLLLRLIVISAVVNRLYAHLLSTLQNLFFSCHIRRRQASRSRVPCGSGGSCSSRQSRQWLVPVGWVAFHFAVGQGAAKMCLIPTRCR